MTLTPIELILQDPDVDDEDLKAIQDGKEVELTTGTHGWQIIKQELLDQITRYEETVELSGKMEETYGAAKTLSGLKFVFRLVEDIIEDGQKAIARYKKK